MATQGEEGGKLGDCDWHIHYYKITNKDLLYSTGNSTQHSAMVYMRKNLKRSECMYMYNWLTASYCTAVTNNTVNKL